MLASCFGLRGNREGVCSKEAEVMSEDIVSGSCR